MTVYIIIITKQWQETSMIKLFLLLILAITLFITVPAKAETIVSQENFDNYCEKGRNRTVGRTKPMTHRGFKMTHR